jgi:hypothetical protein
MKQAPHHFQQRLPFETNTRNDAAKTTLATVGKKAKKTTLGHRRFPKARKHPNFDAHKSSSSKKTMAPAVVSCKTTPFSTPISIGLIGMAEIGFLNGMDAFSRQKTDFRARKAYRNDTLGTI